MSRSEPTAGRTSCTPTTSPPQPRGSTRQTRPVAPPSVRPCSAETHLRQPAAGRAWPRPRPSRFSDTVRGVAAATIHDLTTPALVVDATALQHNLAEMARALPDARLRPHVKAHKCTSLAKRQLEAGHRSFTCATVREMEGMAAAGLGEDLLLPNEGLQCSRLGALGVRARWTGAGGVPGARLGRRGGRVPPVGGVVD